MSSDEQVYPYYLPGRAVKHYDNNIIQRLENKINHLEKEISKIKNGTNCVGSVGSVGMEHLQENIYNGVIRYVNSILQNCQSNNININRQTRILTGNGAPSNSLGENGDFYLDNTNGNYYVKIAGMWILRGNLQGPPGLPGSRILAGNGPPNNTLGNVGDFYIDNITKVYYLKVDTAANTSVITVQQTDTWQAQGSLDSSVPNTFALPIAFGSPVNLEPSNYPTMIAYGNNASDVIFSNSSGFYIINPSSLLQNMLFYVPVDTTVSQITASFTNIVAINNDNRIEITVQIFQSISTNTYTTSRVFVNLFVDRSAPALTTVTATVRPTSTSGGAYVIPAGTTIFFGVDAQDLDNPIQGIVNIKVS